MNTIDNIKQMILEDSHRWQCPKYSGVVVVHPDQVEDVISMVCVEHPDKTETFNKGSFWKDFKFKGGGNLTVSHMESPEGTLRKAEHNHAGMRYTSVMFSFSFAGSFEQLRQLPNLVDGEQINCMAYMMSRLYSQSEHPIKFVMM